MGLNEHMIPYEEYRQLDRFFKIEDTLPDDARMDKRERLYVYGQSEPTHFMFASHLADGSETAAWKRILETYAEKHGGHEKRGRIPWKVVTFICREEGQEDLFNSLGHIGNQIADEYGIKLIGWYLSTGELSAVAPLYTDNIIISTLPVARIVFSYTNYRGVTKDFPRPWPQKSYQLWRKFRNIVAYLPEHFETRGGKGGNNAEEGEKKTAPGGGDTRKHKIKRLFSKGVISLLTGKNFITSKNKTI